MPIRVGLDLTSTPDVAASLARWGSRYTAKVFTTGELADAGGDPARLAARFAAKEAAIKMLAPGADAPGWRDVEVRTRPGGALALHWHGAAARLAAAAGVDEPAVSVTHEGPWAAAVVVALSAR